MDIEIPNFSGRLRAAREAAGYPTGAAAIKAIGIDVEYILLRRERTPAQPAVEHRVPDDRRRRTRVGTLLAREMIEAAARRIDAARKGRRIK
jgi:hypothetical protein